MSSNASPKLGRLWLGLIILGGMAGLVFVATQMKGVASTSDPEPKLTHVVKRGNLRITVIEQGGLESSKNIEIKCQVRGQNMVTWVIENGTYVEPGDVLVRLDTLALEESINERSKYAHWSRSAAESSQANLARSKLAVSEYTEGRYVSQLMTLEKNLAIAESNFLTATNMLQYAKKLSEKGFLHDREIEQKMIALEQAKLDVEARKMDIEVLKKYTRAMQLKTLEGNLNSAEATHNANEERAVLDEKRRDQALEELEHCVIKAEKSGLVIFPSAAAWKSSPDVAEGATVHKDQVLLLMPDLMKMQVKVGIHESIIDRIKTGLKATIALPDETLTGDVTTVASVAQPAGWWTGNVVKYETIVSLPSKPGLKPGMSAEVEIILAEYENVLKLPVTAILETNNDTLCWVKTSSGARRRPIKIGDSDDVFVIVEEGLEENEEVVLNPVAYIKQAQDEALRSIEEEKQEEDSPDQKPTNEDQTVSESESTIAPPEFSDE